MLAEREPPAMLSEGGSGARVGHGQARRTSIHFCSARKRRQHSLSRGLPGSVLGGCQLEGVFATDCTLRLPGSQRDSPFPVICTSAGRSARRRGHMRGRGLPASITATAPGTRRAIVQPCPPPAEIRSKQTPPPTRWAPRNALAVSRLW